MNCQETLAAVKKAKGYGTKAQILKENNSATLKAIIWYANHPLKHFNIKQIPWTGKGTQTIEDHILPIPSALREVTQKIPHLFRIREVLIGLSTRDLSGQAAKDVVKKVIEDLTYDDGEVFKMVLKKDLRCGVKAATANKVFGADFIPVFGCMLASKYEDIDLSLNDWYMSLKLDGLRGRFLDGTMYTRNGHPIVGVEHITEALTDLGHTSLDGELLIPGEHFQVSSGQIRSDSPSTDALYYVFDNALPNVSFKDRLKQLNELTLPNCVKLVKHIPIRSLGAIDRNFHKALEAGYEGLVLKSASHLYKQSRSKDWLKVKAIGSLELQILGVYEGEGKWQGMAGGCICLYEGIEVRASSGRLSDHDKAIVWENKAEYTGRYIEVLFHEKTPTGSLRHPRMKSRHARGDL